VPGGDWKDVPDSLKIELKNDKNETIFRAVNNADVAGPKHKLITER